MAQRVVDVLEAIEVQQKNSEHLLIATRGQQRLAQTVAEQAAVRQARKCVVESLVFQRVGVRLAFRDIAERRDEHVTRPDLHRADDELEREKAAVLSLAHRLVRAAYRDVQCQAALQVVVECAPMGCRDEDIGLLSHQVLLGVAE